MVAQQTRKGIRKPYLVFQMKMNYRKLKSGTVLGTGKMICRVTCDDPPIAVFHLNGEEQVEQMNPEVYQMLNLKVGDEFEMIVSSVIRKLQAKKISRKRALEIQREVERKLGKYTF